MKKTNLIMLGAPGSGKGTRAVALCEVLNVIQVATGDLFRNNIKEHLIAFNALRKKSYSDTGRACICSHFMIKHKVSQSRNSCFM